MEGVNYNEEEGYHDELAIASSVVDKMPPGFRFHPTDSEIIDHYLLKKVKHRLFRAVAIGEIDLNKCEPWDLPQKAKMGENEWWFFFEKETKYPSGMRTNRATALGYWKATGKDKEIYREKKLLVGMKKTLVFYKGRAPKGEKTNWVIHEYRLHTDYNLSTHAKERWVVCKVFNKKNEVRTNPAGVQLARNDSCVDCFLLDSPTSLPPLTDYEKPNSSYAPHDFKPATTLILNNDNTLQDGHNNLLFPHIMINSFHAPQMVHPNSVFPHQPPSLVYQHQHGTSLPTIERDATNLIPIKGTDHIPNSRIGAPDIYIGGKEPEGMGKVEESEINGSESNMQCDDVVVESLGFSPNVSDLDSLWN